MEIWKDITWYEWLYQISNFWRVKSLERYIINSLWRKCFIKERILRITINKWYECINFTINNKTHSKKIHRLVAKSFIINPENKSDVNHINWIKTDNRVENLEWVTKSENELHKYNILWYKNFFQTNHPFKGKFWKDNHLSKKVWLYKNWKLIHIYYWIREAVRESNFCENSIIKSLKKWILIKGCKWNYL